MFISYTTHNTFNTKCRLVHGFQMPRNHEIWWRGVAEGRYRSGTRRNICLHIPGYHYWNSHSQMYLMIRSRPSTNDKMIKLKTHVMHILEKKSLFFIQCCVSLTAPFTLLIDKCIPHCCTIANTPMLQSHVILLCRFFLRSPIPTIPIFIFLNCKPLLTPSTTA